MVVKHFFEMSTDSLNLGLSNGDEPRTTASLMDWSEGAASSATTDKTYDSYYTTETWTWPADDWPPNQGGTYSLYNSLTQTTTTDIWGSPYDWYLVPFESCAVTSHWEQNDNGTEKSDTYSRVAQTQLYLRTGGKALPGRRNLIVLAASAGYVTDAKWHPGGPQGSPPPELALAPQRMTIQGQSVGTDGYRYLALPDGAEVDITPTIAGCDFYTFDVNPTKHKLLIQANGTQLQPDELIPEAEHAIGEKINLSAVFDPPLPEEPSKTVQWVLDPQYINAYDTWIPDPENGDKAGDESDYDIASGLTNFRVDSGRLQTENTYAWWLSGSVTSYEWKRLYVGMTLVFPDGQVVFVSGRGVLGMHLPTVHWDSSGYVPGVVNGYAELGYIVETGIGDFWQNTLLSG